MVDVGELFTIPAPQDIAEDEERAGREQDTAACKGSVYARLAVEHPAHMDGAATSNAAHVIKFG